jgi:Ca-activated chloride channel family protein
MSGIEWNNIAALYWLWALVPLAILVAWTITWRRRATDLLIERGLQQRIMTGVSHIRPAVRALLCFAALICLVIALADPRAGRQEEEVTRHGADVMFVVDVSRSMLAEDATPSRLDRAKAFIDDAVRRMGGDRAGLVDFAGSAAMRTPLTLNYGALMSSVDDLTPKDSARGGSMLGAAITTAVNSFPSDSTAGRAIVVLTDGEDMDSNPVAAAKAAFESNGIRVITVGIGDARDGGRIPLETKDGRTWLVHEGQEVWSKMDPTTLQAVADAGGGIFVPAGTAQIDLGEVLDRALGDLERRDFETTTVVLTSPQFQWLAGAALLMLLIELLLPNPRTVSTAAPRARRSVRLVEVGS